MSPTIKRNLKSLSESNLTFSPWGVVIETQATCFDSLDFVAPFSTRSSTAEYRWPFDSILKSQNNHFQRNTSYNVTKFSFSEHKILIGHILYFGPPPKIVVRQPQIYLVTFFSIFIWNIFKYLGGGGYYLFQQMSNQLYTDFRYAWSNLVPSLVSLTSVKLIC